MKPHNRPIPVGRINGRITRDDDFAVRLHGNGAGDIAPRRSIDYFDLVDRTVWVIACDEELVITRAAAVVISSDDDFAVLLDGDGTRELPPVYLVHHFAV